MSWLKRVLRTLFPTRFRVMKLLSGQAEARVQVELLAKLVGAQQRQLDAQAKQAAADMAKVERLAMNEFQQLTAMSEVRAWLDGRPMLPSARGWAISPDIAVYVLQQLEAHRPRQILDVGSGLSTLLFAKYAANNPGVRVVSLDHEAVYYQATARMLAAWQLTGVELLHAPLVPYPALGVADHEWYDVGGIAATARFDFVFVDGPPDGVKTASRRNLVPVLGDRLAPGAQLIMDDANRPSERSVIAAWLADHDIEIVRDLRQIEKGMVHLRRRG